MYFHSHGCNNIIINFAAHLDHIKNITGSEHIGIGANYDGFASVAEGLDDVSKYPELFDKLAESFENHEPWTREELKKLAGENMLRVMLAVETHRDLLKKPAEDIIPPAELINTNCRGTTPAPVSTV